MWEGLLGVTGKGGLKDGLYPRVWCVMSNAPALWGPELVFLQDLCGPDPFSNCQLLSFLFFLYRAQDNPLGLQFLLYVLLTFVLTGSCVAMLCWSQMPMRPSR